MAYKNSNQMLEELYNLLPRKFRYADIDTSYQLKRFLQVLVEGGFYPLYRETAGILDLLDYDKVDAKYLPYLASSLGFEFPYDLDEETQRTYIKNAVSSYKIKGTKTALEYMIRELTRFKTTVETDDINRDISVTLEVDLERQDYAKALDKVKFLVDEYSPPYRNLVLVNTFLWDEGQIYIIGGEDDSVHLTSNEDEPFETAVVETELIYHMTISPDTDDFSLNSADDDVNLHLGMDEGLETNSRSKDDTDVLYSIHVPIHDIDYTLAQMFGTFNGSTTNSTLTFGGETYYKTILEEYMETVTTP